MSELSRRVWPKEVLTDHLPNIVFQLGNRWPTFSEAYLPTSLCFCGQYYSINEFNFSTKELMIKAAWNSRLMIGLQKLNVFIFSLVRHPKARKTVWLWLPNTFTSIIGLLWQLASWSIGESERWIWCRSDWSRGHAESAKNLLKENTD